MFVCDQGTTDKGWSIINSYTHFHVTAGKGSKSKSFLYLNDALGFIKRENLEFYALILKKENIKEEQL
jgi:hypothetical protein